MMSYKIQVLQALYQLIADYGLFEDEDTQVYLVDDYDEICSIHDATRILIECGPDNRRSFFIELHKE